MSRVKTIPMHWSPWWSALSPGSSFATSKRILKITGSWRRRIGSKGTPCFEYRQTSAFNGNWILDNRGCKLKEHSASEGSNDYLEQIRLKRQRNENKLKSLGLFTSPKKKGARKKAHAHWLWRNSIESALLPILKHCNMGWLTDRAWRCCDIESIRQFECLYIEHAFTPGRQITTTCNFIPNLEHVYLIMW